MTHKLVIVKKRDPERDLRVTFFSSFLSFAKVMQCTENSKI